MQYVPRIIQEHFNERLKKAIQLIDSYGIPYEELGILDALHAENLTTKQKGHCL